jgi:predicted dehydrogenase
VLEVAERIIDVASTRNLVVGIDYPMLYTPVVEAVSLFAKSRLSGPLLRLSIENVASCEGLDDQHWFWDEAISGGILVEHGVHFFDWCGRIATSPLRVIAYETSSDTASRKDRALAVVEHERGILASYYHAFVTKPDMERTRTVISFESVDLIIDGWIPTTLHLRGHGAAVATTTMRRMMSRSVASVSDASGFVFDAGPKEMLYRQGIRAGAEDLARSIREPEYVARNDARNTLAGLRVALAARDAAQKAIAINLVSPQISVLP